MQRLRTTFQRSRTPTGADMKTQSSLEVPKQVRSASFDEIQLGSKRGQNASSRNSSEERSGGLLAVPAPGGRSRSFDSAGSDDSGALLDVPRRFRRRRAGEKTPPPCVHCFYAEQWERQRAERDDGDRSPVDLDFSSEDDYDEEDDVLDASGMRITVTPSPAFRDGSVSPGTPGTPGTPGSPTWPISLAFPPSPSIELSGFDDPPYPAQARRRSISRQEAFFVEPKGSSLENVAASEATSECTAGGELSAATVTEPVEVPGVPGLLVRDIYLTVPDLKRDRAASVDSCFSKLSTSAKTEELQHADTLAVPAPSLRSRSVDIVLPTAEQARYKALALSQPPPPTDTHNLR